MITFTCPACRKQLSGKESLAGKKGKCPGCGQPVAVPASGPAPVAEIPTLPPNGRTVTLLPNPPRGLHETNSGQNLDGELTDFLAPPQADDEIGRLGRYRILKVLGRGGMGVVFLAEDPRLRRRVAVKAVLPAMAASANAASRFLREAQAMAAIEHDHVVRVYQVDEERGIVFLAMEYLKGETLDERLARDGTLSLSEVLRVGREMAEGLAAAHETGLIHRDIKPANVWLEAPRGRVKILDFGLARATAENSNLTQQGAIMGTPAFMAPEQARGEPVDARCDLFSLGVVLYRLCTGQPAFQGKDAIATIMEVAIHEPPSPRQLNPAVPAELSELVMKLLEKSPDRRVSSATEVVRDIEEIEKRVIGRPSSSTPPKAPAPSRRRALALTVAAVAGVLALAGTSLFLLRDKPGGASRAAIDDPPTTPIVAGKSSTEPAQGARADERLNKTEPVVANKSSPPKEAPAASPPLTADASPFDRLRREDISVAKRTAAGLGNPEKAPAQIVAIFGESKSKTPIVGFALHPDGKTLALGFHGSRQVKMMDLATRKTRVWSRLAGNPVPRCFSHDGTILALVGDGGLGASLFDSATGKPLQQVTNQATNLGISIAFSPDDRQFFSLPVGGKLQRQWVTGRVPLGTAPPPPLEKANYSMLQMDLSSDGKFLAATSTTNYESCFVQVWDVQTGKLLGKISEKLRPAEVFFRPDGKLLAQIQMYRHETHLFEIPGRKPRGHFKAPSVPTCLAFHPQGNLIATGDAAGRIHVVDARSHTNVLQIQAKPPTSGNEHGGGIRRIVFTPDGRHLITLNGDGTVYVLRLG